MMSKRLLHFTNGNIYASSGRQTSLKTDLLVDRHTGSVVEVWGAGEPKPAAAEVADEVEQTDLEGKLVLPGFHDSHIHVMGLGKMLSSLDLRVPSLPHLALSFSVPSSVCAWVRRRPAP